MLDIDPIRNRLKGLFIAGRQYIFPALFRITPKAVDKAAGQAASLSMLAAFAQQRQQIADSDWQQRLTEAEKAGAAKKNNAECELDRDFIVSLCNEYFRADRNLAKLERQDQPPQQARRIRKSLNDIGWLFERYAIECKDLTGQPYDIGRLDFEQLAEPETAPGLKGPTITLCERPAVVLRGRLLQRAKGLVSKPD